MCKCVICYDVTNEGVLPHCLDDAEEDDDYCLYCEPLTYGKMNICEWRMYHNTPIIYQSIIKIQRWWRTRIKTG